MKDPRFGIENYLRKINLEESHWPELISRYITRKVGSISPHMTYETISNNFEDFRKFVMENTEEVDA